MGAAFLRLSEQRNHFVKTFAWSALVAFAATPALAQAKVHHQKEYYVIHDSETKTCTIVDKRPATHHVMNNMASRPNVVGLGVYHTRAEAEAGMKQMHVCDKGNAHNGSH